MEARDENSYTMILGTQRILQKYHDVFKGIKVFNQAFTTFNQDVKRLGSLIRKIDRLSKTTHKRKQRLQKVVIEESYIFGLVFGLMARHQGDQVSYKRLRLAQRTLQHMRDTQLAEHSKLLLNLALKQRSTLKDYGIDSDRLDDYQISVDRFSKSIGQAQLHVINRKVAQKGFKELLKKIKSDLYFEMDAFVQVVEKKNPRFYKAYLQARQIKDLKRRRKRKSKKIIEFRKIS